MNHWYFDIQYKKMNESSVLGIYIKRPWPSFYKSGMKTWDIRSYSTNYRGSAVLIESETNHIICIANLVDCIELSKQRWEMNFDKHRVSCSFEDLPYFNTEGKAYAWVLGNLKEPLSQIELPRLSRKPIHYFDLTRIQNVDYTDISCKKERFIIKPFGEYLQVFWIQQKYLALVAVIDRKNGKTLFIEKEIEKKDINRLKSELIPKR